MSGPYWVMWRRQLIEKKLADVVLSAMQAGESVAAITSAMNRIDQLLTNDPATRGESRGDLERVLIVTPLTVTFEVHEEERIVFVLTLHYRPVAKPDS